MKSLSEQAFHLTDVEGYTVEEAARHLGIVPDPRIRPGVYVETRWGEAVAIRSGFWVSYRYKAERCSDRSIIWVANSDPCWAVIFLRSGDADSLCVLSYHGPYGDGVSE